MKKLMGERFKSVRMRLFLTLSGVITAIIVVLILTNSIVLEAFYTYSKIYSVKQIYANINDLFNEQELPLEEKLEKMSLQNNVKILIQTDNELIIYSTNQNFANEINSNKDIMKFQSLIKKDKQLIYVEDNMAINIVSTNDIKYILLSGKLDNGYLIYISIPIAAIEESVRISNNLLLIMGAIIILLSAVIASIISKKFTKPILQLNNIANKMANLDFSEKYRTTDSDDEINELGKSINKMSDKLERTIKQLRKNNNQLEKDIEEKSKIDEMRTQFISDVSHELKTPIALIQGYAEGLVENVNSDEESKKYYAEVILDESNKMDKLVRQLLELMKIEYGKREFNDDSFDICELINEVIRKCKVMSEEKQANIMFENTEAINVYADSFYIEQAFTNYITNAIKHVKDVDGRKQIVIKLEDKDEKIRVSVFNTGDNIAEDDIEKIWGRFYKADASRNRADGGTGIGLSLVKAIMNSYNEEYGVINRPDGVEFYFDIKKSKEC